MLSNLILIHGGGVGPWMWRQQRGHFEKRFTVHTPSLPGHTIGSGVDYTTNVAAAQHVAEQIGLANLTGQAIVVGFSVGGQVAIELATMFPDQISRSVIVSSVMRPWRTAALVAWAVGASAPLARNERFARAQSRQLYIPDDDFDAYFALSRAMTKQTLVNVMRANLTFAPPTQFPTSDRPTLFVAGSKEQRSLIRDLSQLASTMPHARFELIDGVGHGAPLAAPAAFDRALDDWLSS